MEATNPFHAWNSTVPSRRACQECNKKKTKCDMQRPICGLCQRVGLGCIFPTKRKPPAARKLSTKSANPTKARTIQQLMHLIQADLQNGVNPEYTMSSSLSPDRGPVPPATRQPPMATIPPDLLPISYPTTWTVPPTRLDSPLVVPERRPLILQAQHPSPVSGLRNISNSRPEELPPELALELIDIYFNKIQAWLPLLHRPRFYQRYEESTGHTSIDLGRLPLEDDLIFNGIFALTARYSSSPFFASVPEADRGNIFADKARALYERARTEIDLPNISYLQGCILLAFYYYASGPCARGWILTGVCIRLAYELELSGIDEEEAPDLTPEEWICREELRRAWWLVWELDTFGSTISARPYTIDRRRMMVFLPVSDQAWFAETPVPSAKLETDPGRAWTSLQGSPNQDERAWFLVGNFLMSIAHDFSQRRKGVSAEEKFALENAINCFNLALPSTFHLETGPLAFNCQDYARSNWIISTHLMMVSTRILISGITASEASPIANSMFLSRTAQLHTRAIEVSRVISHWSPEYITVSHPFIACTMLPVHISGETDVALSPSISASQEIGKLVLSHFARVWKLGTILLKLSEILECPQNITPKDLDLARRFAIFFPHTIKTDQISTLSSDVVDKRKRQGGLCAVNPSNSIHDASESDSAAYRNKIPAFVAPHQERDRLVSPQEYFDSRTQQSINTGMADGTIPNEAIDPSSFDSSDETQADKHWDVRRNSWDATVLDFFGQSGNLDFLELWD